MWKLASKVVQEVVGLVGSGSLCLVFASNMRVELWDTARVAGPVEPVEHRGIAHLGITFMTLGFH